MGGGGGTFIRKYAGGPGPVCFGARGPCPIGTTSSTPIGAVTPVALRRSLRGSLHGSVVGQPAVVPQGESGVIS